MSRTVPDRAALEISQRRVAPQLTFDAAMRDPAIRRAIEARARKHMAARDRYDSKKIQANDND